MAICTSCQQEMHDRVGCALTAFADFEDKQHRQRILFGKETTSIAGGAEFCPDCLSPPGGFHHPGCDIEQCPRCDGQAVSCGCAVEFRPTAKALHTVLIEYYKTHGEADSCDLVFTDVFALGEYQVTSVFHWIKGADPLGWWFFAEEREVSQDILRVTPIHILLDKDPKLAIMLQLEEGKKAFREENSEHWDIRNID